MAEPHRVITMEIDGVPVMVTVEHETSKALADQGFPAERAVYVTSWDDSHIDGTPTDPMAAVYPGRWRRLPGISGTSGSRSPTAPPG